MIDTSQITSLSTLPPASQQSQAAQTQQLTSSDFMNLLVKQLQYQDPMNPIDNADFTAQMAQFSSLQQLVDVNTNLTNLDNSQALAGNSQAVGYLGKEVSASGNSVSVTGGTAPTINYQLGGDASSVVLSITNSSGALVQQVQLGAQGQGAHSYQWDGRGLQNTVVPDGTYSFQVQALDNVGQPVQTTASIQGVVNGLSFQNGSPVLMVAGTPVPLSNVVTVTEPTATQP